MRIADAIKEARKSSLVIDITSRRVPAPEFCVPYRGDGLGPAYVTAMRFAR